MAEGAAAAKVAAGAGQETSPAEVAAGAPSVEVAADAESHKKAPAEIFFFSQKKHSFSPKNITLSKKYHSFQKISLFSKKHSFQKK